MGFASDATRGVQVHYGARATNGKYGAKFSSDTNEKTVEWVFSYDDLPGPGTSSMQAVIPAYAKLLSCYIEVLEPFTGGTSYDIGLQQDGGTEIENDGLFDELPIASINARGKIVKGGGALLPASTVDTSDTGAAGDVVSTAMVSIGANAGELKVAATGSFTGGKARLILKYKAE